MASKSSKHLSFLGKLGQRFRSENVPYARRHMFRAYRTSLRLVVAPLFVAISFVDFVQMPEQAPLWLGIRIALALYVWISFHVMARSAWARRNIYKALIILIALASAFCNLTIYQTGGVGSPYLPGLIVAACAFVLMFRLGPIGSVLSQALMCIPGAVILLTTAPPERMMDAVVASSFYLSMLIVAWSGKLSSDELTGLIIRTQRIVKSEMDRHRRSEFLKNHFPPSLREEIENGKVKLERREVIPDAVVCFADLIGSTKIGNTVNLETDWKLKETFLSAATIRATECGMVVLNQSGDGFLFIANYRNPANWEKNLIEFYEKLTVDLQDILTWMKAEIGQAQSGIRFGVSQGPVMLGWIGNAGQSYFTAMGPEVNLASRLCSAAGENEMVLSSRVSFAIHARLLGRETYQKVYTDLKGFDQPIPAIHVKPRSAVMLGSRDAELDNFIETFITEQTKKKIS